MRTFVFVVLCSSLLLPQTSSSHSRKGSAGNAGRSASATCGTACGIERWSLKTLTDKDAGLFQSATPTDTTISKLVAEKAPAVLGDSRAPLEKQLFHVKALLIGWKIEAGNSKGTTIGDHDFHIVVADPDNTNRQMIVEVPDPQCRAVCSSAFLAQIQAARNAVSKQLGKPATTVRALPKPWLVELTGPAFFDFAHGQTGLARNCIELHPILQISFLEQKSTPVHVNKATELTHQCGRKSGKRQPATRKQQP